MARCVENLIRGTSLSMTNASRIHPSQKTLMHKSFYLSVLLVLLGTESLLGQLPSARLNALFPPVVKVGESIEVTVSRIDLDDLKQIQFSVSGITATPKMGEPGPFDNAPTPVTNQFVVTVAANVLPGVYDARVVGKYGVSNPRAFIVSDLQTSIETEPNNTQEQATEITTPASISGQAGAAADVDYFKFTGTAGQRLIIECNAHRIDSHLDAIVAVYDSAGRELDSSRDQQSSDPVLDFTVPAAGDYFIKIHDALFRGNTPQRSYFYEFSIGVLPHIDFVFPPSGLAGSNGSFTLFGRNLPGGQNAGILINGKPLQSATVSIPLSGGVASTSLEISSPVSVEVAAIDGKAYRIKGSQGLSNSVMVGIATDKIVLESEPNTLPEQAQKVTIPCEVVGQFYPAKDRDWFTFNAQAGDVYWIEVISQRMGLPTDPNFVVQQVTTDTEGKQQIKLVASVDQAMPPIGIMAECDTRHDDPIFKLEVVADATYRILLRDAYSDFRNDPRNVYRMTIRRAKPDFRLVAVPDGTQAALLLRKGGSAAIRVVAIKQDGFEEPITVTATGIPAGVTCPSVVIGPGRDSATLVLTAADGAAPAFGLLQITGTGKVGAANVVRPARTGAVTWELPPRVANQPQLSGESRLSRNIVVAISGDEVAPATVTAGGGKVWETSRAGIVKIPFTAVRRNEFKGNIVVTSADLPPNIDSPAVTLAANVTAGEFQITLKPNTPVGTYTINLSAIAQNVPYARNPEAAKAAAERRTEFEKINTDTQAAAKAAVAVKTVADKMATDAAAILLKATDKKTAFEKVVVQSDATLKTVTDQLAVAKAALAKTPGDLKLATNVTTAQKTVTDATAKLKTDVDAVTAAQKAIDVATVQLTVATTAKMVADKANEEADLLAKAATAEKVIVDKRATDTANAAKPANKNVSFLSTPVTISIAPAPITLAATNPVAALKQGEKMEITVTITRLFSYDQPVAISTVLPGGVNGLTIPNVTIPAGQTQIKCTMTAAANATPGSHQITVRATLKLNNQNLVVDQPVTLNVQKVEPAK